MQRYGYATARPEEVKAHFAEHHYFQGRLSLCEICCEQIKKYPG